MPYKNEHAARQKDPDQYSDFKRVHETLAPDGIDFIYGVKADGSAEIQSVRADAEAWTVESFRAWLLDHELTDSMLVPAAEPEQKEGDDGEELAEGDESSTPAEPDEQIKGSEENDPGSAAGDRGGIQVSEETEETLRAKALEHNEAVAGDLSKRTDLGALKAVYRRGAGAFSTSHRPGMTRAQWAYARVNAFLHLLKTGKPKNAKYLSDNDLLPAGHPRSSKKEETNARELAQPGAEELTRLPMFVREALRKGLKLHEQGRSGEGLQGETVRQASIGASSGEWSEDKIVKAAAWFERHAGDRKLKDGRKWNVKGAETAGYVAWLLWGSDANDRGASWVKKEAAKIRREREEMTQAEKVDADELGYKPDENMAFEPKEGDPLAPYRDPDSSVAPMIPREDIASDADKDIHVMRLGALYDLDSGELVMNLNEQSAKEIARTTNAMLGAGHFLPISFEHGIEGGQRAQPGADRRPYGEILAVYFDEARRGIYARKRWTKLGKQLLLDSMTEDGRTAVRVSPRVIMKPAYHPNTGERLGDSYMDVVSLTTMPRQDRMEAVALSRGTVLVEDVAAEVAADLQQMAADVATAERVEMTEQNTEKVDVLLARGSDEAATVFKAAGLEDDAPAIELARKFDSLNAELSRVANELSKYRTEELNRLAAEKATEVEEFLNNHSVSDVEREFFKVSLLSEDEATAELARNTIIARGLPDKLATVEDAVTEAKKRGAVPADFAVEGELAELSRTAPDVAVGIINAIPGDTVVRVGEPAGSDSAGVETASTFSKEEAGVELSRLARGLIAEGKVTSLIEAHRMAKTERPDLVAATKEEK